METGCTREQALELLRKYNKEPFHIRHALTVEAVMGYYAETSGYAEDADFWKMAGLMHDVDFERYPDRHCLEAPRILGEIGASDALIHAVCSHGYGITADVDRRTRWKRSFSPSMN